MSALSKQIEGEIAKKNFTEIPTVRCKTRMLVTQYGYALVFADELFQRQYRPPELVQPEITKVDSQIAFLREELRMWERVKSAIERWQEQGEQE